MTYTRHTKWIAAALLGLGCIVPVHSATSTVPASMDTQASPAMVSGDADAKPMDVEALFGWFIRGDALLFDLQPGAALKEYELGRTQRWNSGAYAVLRCSLALAELGDFPRALATLDQVLPGRYFSCGFARQGVKRNVEDLRVVWQAAILPDQKRNTRLQALIAGKEPRRAQAATLAMFGILMREGKPVEARQLLQRHRPLAREAPHSEEARLLAAHYQALFPAAIPSIVPAPIVRRTK